MVSGMEEVQVRSELDHVRLLLSESVDLEGMPLEDTAVELSDLVGAYRIQELVTALNDAGVTWKPSVTLLRTLEGQAPWTYPDMWAYALVLLDHVTPDVTPAQLIETAQAMRDCLFPPRVLDYLRTGGERMSLPSIVMALDVADGRDHAEVSEWVLSSLEPGLTLSDLRTVFEAWSGAPVDATRVLGLRYRAGLPLSLAMAVAVGRTAEKYPEALDALEALVSYTAVTADTLEATVKEFVTFGVPLWFVEAARDRVFYDQSTPEALAAAEADSAFSQAAWQLSYPVPGRPVPSLDDVNSARELVRAASRAREEAASQLDPASVRSVFKAQQERLNSLHAQGVDLVSLVDDTLEWPKMASRTPMRVASRTAPSVRSM